MRSRESLELEKGSGDVAVNSLPMDSLPVLAARPNLQIEETRRERRFSTWRSTCATRCCKDVRVRQAIACAIDRELIIEHAAARPCAAGVEPAACQPLGLDRRCCTLRLRSGAGGAAAG